MLSGDDRNGDKNAARKQNYAIIVVASGFATLMQK